MKPGDLAGKPKIKRLHQLFRRLGPAAEEGVRDEIERLTGQRSTKGLTESDAWGLIMRLSQQAGVRNPIPIIVDWCPVYTKEPVEKGGLAATRLPSQKQVFFLWVCFEAGNIRNPRGYLVDRFQLKDGIIRTAQDAWLVTKALRHFSRSAYAGRTGSGFAPKSAWTQRGRAARELKRPPGKAAEANET